MKKFILIALLGVFTLAVGAQNVTSVNQKGGITAGKVTTVKQPRKTATSKKDTTLVPLYLENKTDTIHNLNVWYCTEDGFAKHADGFETFTGFWNEQYKKWINVKDGDVYVYLADGRLYKVIDRDHLLSLTQKQPKTPPSVLPPGTQNVPPSALDKQAKPKN